MAETITAETGDPNIARSEEGNTRTTLTPGADDTWTRPPLIPDALSSNGGGSRTRTWAPMSPFSSASFGVADFVWPMSNFFLHEQRQHPGLGNIPGDGNGGCGPSTPGEKCPRSRAGAHPSSPRSQGRSTAAAAFRPDDHKLHCDNSNGPKKSDAGTNTSDEGQQFQRTTWVLAKRLPPPTLVVVAEAPFISAKATNPAGRYCGLTANRVPTECTTRGSERSAAGATQNRTKVRRGRCPAFLISITEMALFIVGGIFGIIGLVALVATVAGKKRHTARRPGWWSWPRLIPRRPPRSIGRSYWVLLIFWRPFFFATAFPKGTLTDLEFKLATWGTFELLVEFQKNCRRVWIPCCVCVQCVCVRGGL
jgi:hypothetical protein